MISTGFTFEDLTFRSCECCKTRYAMATCTVTVGERHKWTEKEIKERILDLAEQMSQSKWYNRGDIRRQIKHWTEKLARYKELKEEFK